MLVCMPCVMIFMIPYVFRVQLATLHFNENSNRAQATTIQGEERYDVVSLSTRKGATLSARLQWTPYIVSSNYFIMAWIHLWTVSINLCRLCG